MLRRGWPRWSTAGSPMGQHTHHKRGQEPLGWGRGRHRPTPRPERAPGLANSPGFLELRKRLGGLARFSCGLSEPPGLERMLSLVKAQGTAHNLPREPGGGEGMVAEINSPKYAV